MTFAFGGPALGISHGWVVGGENAMLLLAPLIVAVCKEESLNCLETQSALLSFVFIYLYFI